VTVSLKSGFVKVFLNKTKTPKIWTFDRGLFSFSNLGF